MAQMDTRVEDRKTRLGKREQLLLLEIGRDRIDTASSFVNYMEEEYGFSKSSVWYNLKRLKEMGLLEFASREEIGKPLSLTKPGMEELSRVGRGREELVRGFESVYTQRMRGIGAGIQYGISQRYGTFR
ncbi:MAG: hypothetical protein KGH58_02985 [Candidatus Micrarchaeota archaeon]|nr:hypothetical protein [Candidatus Micrarchaeota archaeon]